jgi:peroxiredoxin
MKKMILSLDLVVIILLAGLLFPYNLSAKSSPDPSKVDNFSLKDYNGKSHSLNDYKNSKAIVLIFISTQCPVSNGYNERMAALQKKYSSKNITFLGINANKEEKAGDIKAHAEKNKFEFPVLKDENNKIADKLGASVTPEVYVLSPGLEVLYHGRIDDSRDASNVSSNDLASALDEILSGKKVSNTRTKAFGCSIKRIDS